MVRPATGLLAQPDIFKSVTVSFLVECVVVRNKQKIYGRQISILFQFRNFAGAVTVITVTVYVAYHYITLEQLSALPQTLTHPLFIQIQNKKQKWVKRLWIL